MRFKNFTKIKKENSILLRVLTATENIAVPKNTCINITVYENVFPLNTIEWLYVYTYTLYCMDGYNDF